MQLGAALASKEKLEEQLGSALVANLSESVHQQHAPYWGGHLH